MTDLQILIITIGFSGVGIFAIKQIIEWWKHRANILILIQNVKITDIHKKDNNNEADIFISIYLKNGSVESNIISKVEFLLEDAKEPKIIPTSIQIHGGDSYHIKQYRYFSLPNKLPKELYMFRIKVFDQNKNVFLKTLNLPYKSKKTNQI